MNEVHIINVGYGDAALILQKGYDGFQFSMLIDCGGETTGNDDPTGFRITAEEYLKMLGVKKIDIILLSHLHLDHSGGICAIAENFDVGELWTNYVPDEHWENIQTIESFSSGPKNLVKSLHLYMKALEIFRSKNTVIRTVTEDLIRKTPVGTIRIITGNETLYKRQAEILDGTFIHNEEETPLRELDEFINNTSLRAELVSNGVVFLFPGDICASEWEKGGVSRADVVKLPHHGHADSMNDAIARKLNSKYTVISVSNTRTDNCPNPEIIKMLETSGSSVLFTDAVNMPDYQVKKHNSIVFSVDAEGALMLKFNIGKNNI